MTYKYYAGFYNEDNPPVGGTWVEFTKFLVSGNTVLNQRVESENPGQAGAIVFDNIDLTFFYSQYFNPGGIVNPVYAFFHNATYSSNLDLYPRVMIKITANVPDEIIEPDGLTSETETQIFLGMIDFSSITYPVIRDESGEYITTISFTVVEKLSALALLQATVVQRTLSNYSSRLPVGTTAVGIFDGAGKDSAPFKWTAFNDGTYNDLIAMVCFSNSNGTQKHGASGITFNQFGWDTIIQGQTLLKVGEIVSIPYSDKSVGIEGDANIRVKDIDNREEYIFDLVAGYYGNPQYTNYLVISSWLGAASITIDSTQKQCTYVRLVPILNTESVFTLALGSDSGTVYGLWFKLVALTEMKYYSRDYYKSGNYIEKTPLPTDINGREYIEAYDGLKMLQSILSSRWKGSYLIKNLKNGLGTMVDFIELPLYYFDMTVDEYPLNQEALDAVFELVRGIKNSYLYTDTDGSFVLENKNYIDYNSSYLTLPVESLKQMTKKHMWDKLVDSVTTYVKSWIRNTADTDYIDGSATVSIRSNIKPRNEKKIDIIAISSDLIAYGIALDSSGNLVPDTGHSWSEFGTTVGEVIDLRNGMVLNYYAERVAAEYLSFYGVRRFAYEVPIAKLTSSMLPWKMLNIFKFNALATDGYFFATSMVKDLSNNSMSMELVSRTGATGDTWKDNIVAVKSNDEYVSGGGGGSNESGSVVASGGVSGDSLLWDGRSTQLNSALGRESLELLEWLGGDKTNNYVKDLYVRDKIYLGNGVTGVGYDEKVSLERYEGSGANTGINFLRLLTTKGVTIGSLIIGVAEENKLDIDFYQGSTAGVDTINFHDPLTVNNNKVIAAAETGFTGGDILVYNSYLGNWKKLGLTGVDGSVLNINRGITGIGIEWGSGLTGTVFGPAIHNDNYIPLWNGANSKLLKNGLEFTSLATISTIVARNGSGNSYFNNVFATNIVAGSVSTQGYVKIYNGVNTYWGEIVSGAYSGARTYTLPDINSSTFIMDGGSYSNPNWITTLAETKVLPSQTGNNGKFLTTNGTSTSWITTGGYGTINEIAYFNSASTIASLAVATYPSLTELSYVKGVTSAVQTQINSKIGLTSLSGTSPITYNNTTGAIGLNQAADYTWSGTHIMSGTLKSAGAGVGANGYVINSSGIFGYSATLGTVFSLPTSGAAPTFSSGIINSVTFNLYNASVIRTSTTVGDGSALSAGILMNDTGIYGVGANQLTANANFKLLTSTGYLTATGVTLTGNITATSGSFTGSLYSSIGTIGGWTLGATTLTGTNSLLSSSGYISFGATPPTSYGNNVGAWLGYSTGAKLSLYSDASNYMQWNGSALSVGGATITGGAINGTIITGGTIQTATIGERITLTASPSIAITFYGINGYNSYLYGGDNPIGGTWIGASNQFLCVGLTSSSFISGTNLAIGSGKFSVNTLGQLTLVNTIGATSKYTLVGDGNSFTPRLLAMSDLPAQTANRVLLSDASGYVTASTVTNTTLGYLDATSSIQTQLNAKQATITGAATTITSSNLTASKIAVSDVSGKVAVSSIASSELFTPAYGELYDNVGTSTITTNGTTYVKWAGSTVGNTKGVTGDITNDNLTIDAGQGGVYKISYSVTFNANTADAYYWSVNVAGSGIGKMRMISNVVTTGASYTINGVGIVTLAATNTIDLGCFSTNGRIVTVTYANLNVVKISN